MRATAQTAPQKCSPSLAYMHYAYLYIIILYL